MSYTPPPYSASDAPSLFQVATVANFPLTGTPALPGNWSAVRFHADSGGVQVFTAYGYLLADPNNLVALVIFGFPWSQFLQNYVTIGHTFGPLPTGLLPKSPSASIDDQFSSLYQTVRTQLWKQVMYLQTQVSQFQTCMPILTVGYGPAAPFAQLAALDLLPGRTYVSGSGKTYTSPAASVTSYAFSAPAFGNAAFVNAYSSSAGVPLGYVINLQTSTGDSVDLFPQTLLATQMQVAGVAQGPGQAVPVPVCPWLEHEQWLYGNALNGASQGAGVPVEAAAMPPQFARGRLPVVRQTAGPQAQAGVLNPPAGYDASLAYALSLLCSCVYQAWEHPMLPSNIPTPYSAGQALSVNGVTWGSTFLSPNTVTVVFRGPITWEECITMWGDNPSQAIPAWLPTTQSQIGVYQSYDTIYEALRPALRTLLASYGSGTQVCFAGHGGGGPIATMAYWDLSINPLTGLTASSVYTFGAAPVANQPLQLEFAAAPCSANSYQIVRPNDIIPNLALVVTGAFFPLGQPILLPGGATDPRNGFSSHSIVMYQSLLNTTSLAAPAEVPEAIHATYQAHLQQAGIPWNEVHKCALSTGDNHGSITLSWNKAESFVPASRYLSDDTACIPLQDVMVQPGDTLTMCAPHGQKLAVVMRSLQLGPGAEVRIHTDVTLHLGHLSSTPAQDEHAPLQAPARFVFVGTPGNPGPDGASGSNGANGGPNASGAPGSMGGNGGLGSNGGPGPNGTLHLGAITGDVQIIISGGAGGSGGDGGSGGNGGDGGSLGLGILAPGGFGGDGGSGGNGGNGGPGGTVQLYYASMSPGARILLDTAGAQGGQGGSGGKGGAAGRGVPQAPMGRSGGSGVPGRQGADGTLIVHPRSPAEAVSSTS